MKIAGSESGSGSIIQRNASGSTPKCHGSATLISIVYFNFLPQAECKRLEVDVQSFEEKKKLMEKIDKLALKKGWSRFEECRRACFQCKERYCTMKVGYERGLFSFYFCS
jgi:hypothetical protein